jgi:hypothetical protein
MTIADQKRRERAEIVAERQSALPARFAPGSLFS